MTDIGKLLMKIYSISTLLFIVIKDFKGGKEGWRTASLIPILILLANI